MVAIRKGHLQEWPLVSIHVVQVVKKVLTEQSFTRTLKQRERRASDWPWLLMRVITLIT